MTKKRATGFAILLVVLLLGAGLAALSFPQASPQAPAQASAQNRPGGVGNSRGQYLVEEVARCWECHTPMAAQGQWDQTKWLQGAAVWFRPIPQITEWAYSAPRIAGLPSFTDEQARTILEKGIGPNGLAIRLPMHTYRLSPEDSQAVIAYLRSYGRK